MSPAPYVTLGGCVSLHGPPSPCTTKDLEGVFWNCHSPLTPWGQSAHQSSGRKGRREGILWKKTWYICQELRGSELLEEVESTGNGHFVLLSVIPLPGSILNFSGWTEPQPGLQKTRFRWLLSSSQLRDFGSNILSSWTSIFSPIKREIRSI